MNEIIKTSSVGSGIVDVTEDFVLSEEPMSRLVFHAKIHKHGIRGRIIRQRRESKEDIWKADESIDIRTLGKKESINIDINTEAVENLYVAISKLAEILNQQGINYGKKEYAVVDPNSVIITDANKVEYIRKILEAGYDQDVLKVLEELKPDLVSKLSYAQIQNQRSKIIEEFKGRLQNNVFKETSGEDSWQKWIYTNNWLFGVNYRMPIEKTKINLVGIMPDYLFPTIDDFVDILEIKLPGDEVIREDKTHLGSWIWTQEANKSIGQVINYLSEVDRQRYEIEKMIKDKYKSELSLLKPRAFILIGNSSEWSSVKKDALRKMNHALHGIEILTYSDLLSRGEQALNVKILL